MSSVYTTQCDLSLCLPMNLIDKKKKFVFNLSQLRVCVCVYIYIYIRIYS
jgi:hypothetical protein